MTDDVSCLCCKLESSTTTPTKHNNERPRCTVQDREGDRYFLQCYIRKAYSAAQDDPAAVYR